MSSKLTRRDAIRALAAAGAVIAAAPYIGKVSGAVQSSRSVTIGTTTQQRGEGPLVIVVAEEGMMAFRGEQELRVDDPNLASQLRSTFQARELNE